MKNLKRASFRAMRDSFRAIRDSATEAQTESVTQQSESKDEFFNAPDSIAMLETAKQLLETNQITQTQYDKLVKQADEFCVTSVDCTGECFVSHVIPALEAGAEGKLGMRLGVMPPYVIVLRLTRGPDGTSQRAESAGVKVGDRILSINDEDIYPDRIQAELASARFPLKLGCHRGGKDADFLVKHALAHNAGAVVQDSIFTSFKRRFSQPAEPGKYGSVSMAEDPDAFHD